MVAGNNAEKSDKDCAKELSRVNGKRLGKCSIGKLQLQ